MFRYETHLHTFPVSRCGKASAEETVDFYKAKGYDGVFITNHYIGSNINVDENVPFEEKVHFYFSDYKRALARGREVGLKVFPGVELSNNGTDFLVYGLDEDWFLAHPEITVADKKEYFALMREAGALVIHAHPFREDQWIDHLRLYPRDVDGIEIINAGRTDFQNHMAQVYAEEYGLLPFAGSDNHRAGNCARLAGVDLQESANSVEEFISAIRGGRYAVFCENL